MAARKSRLQLLWIWVAIVTLYFLWEAASYRGLFALTAEWQFDHFGAYLPTFTLGLLILLLASPALLLFRRRRRNDTDAPEVPATAPALLAGVTFMRFLFGLAAALALAALASLLWTLTLPSSEGPPRTLVLGTPADRAPSEGPTTLVGAIVYKRTAAFTQGMVVMRRGARYAPIFGPNGDERTIRYFVELSPQQHAQLSPEDVATPHGGTLVQGGLPGALVRLYRYAGYHVSWPYYVLYASPLTMRWSYYVTAAEFGLGALLFLIVALFQRRHIGRMRDPKPEGETPRAAPQAG